MIGLFKVHMPAAVDKPLLEVLHSGYIGQGKKVEEFERKLGERLGTTNVLTLNSGTSAILLALRLAGVEPGDEVVTTPMTCMATNEPIMELGATPVWADVYPDTGLIDPLDVARKITPKTKAIVCVDWGGSQCDIATLNRIAQSHGISLIEDAAHGFGTTALGADFICFSFQAIKHITTVDGGMLVCKRESDYQRAKLLRWYGIDREGERKDFRCEEDVKEWGYKFHMNDVNATIGIVALKHLPEILDKHRQNALFYEFNITNPLVKKPKGYIEGYSSWWLYTLRVSNRNSFMQHMKDCGVMVSRVHERNDIHSVTKKFIAPLPGVDKFVSEMCCIPVHSQLTVEELTWITSAVNAFHE